MQMELIAKRSFLRFLYLLPLVVLGRSYSAVKDLSAVTFRLQSCGGTGSHGPGPNACAEFYRLQGSPVADHWRQSPVPGAQVFRVPRSGLYNVTVAGASGGEGVCHPPGRGYALLATFNFTKGQELTVIVGQKGLSGCKNASGVHIPFCQRWMSRADPLNCTREWSQEINESNYLVFRVVSLYLFEGGGGGGGASMIQLAGDTEPLMVTGGGGGGGAIYSQTILEGFLRFQSDAHPPSATPSTLSGYSGWSFEQPVASAGVGAGYNADPRATDATDGGPLSSDRGPAGGADCLDVHREPTPVLHSGGGFGGGGGGCENGGGGGGYTGGRVSNYESDASLYLPGEGGYSYVTSKEGLVHPHTDLGFNEGDGYVEILPLNCLCTGECLIVDGTFCCSCPANTMVAPDGFDCFQDSTVTLDSGHMVVSEYGILVHHAISPVPSVANSSGEESRARTWKLFVLSVYSVEVMMSVEPAGGSGSSLRGCVLLLVDGDGQVTATSEWIPVSVNSSSYNQMVNALLPVTQTSNSSLVVPSSASRYLDTPVDAVYLTVASVGAECQLNNATVHVSTLERDVVNVSTQLNPSGVAGLLQLLAPPPPPANSPTTGLSPGALAGVVIACVVAVLLVSLSAVSVILFTMRWRKQKCVKLLETPHRGSVASDYRDARALPLHRNPLYVNTHAYTTIPTLEPKFGVSAPEGTDFTAFNLARVTANLKEWEYPRENLIYLRELGEGQYGKVHLMKAKDICGYKGMLPVAVKTLSTLKKEEMEKFYEEIEMMRTFTHPNIVSLLGMCSEVEDGPPMLILELMQYGDLRSFLMDNEPKEGETPRLGLPHFYGFAADVANALVFLLSKQYIHRDIAARNCLVGQGLQVKLADFGLARRLQDQDYYRLARTTMLPLRWMAPECVLYGTFVQESDIWSFGVLLWEIVTYCDQPYVELDTNGIIAKIEMKSLSLPRPPTCPPEYYAKIQQCQDYDPAQRPSITDLHQFFTSRASELKEAIVDSIF